MELIIAFSLLAIAAALSKIALTPIRQNVITVNVPELPVVVNIPAGTVKVIIPGDVSKMAQDAHRAAILHKQPDGTWHEVGHADFESKNNPGERITRELSTEGRAILWPDGTIQESVIG